MKPNLSEALKSLNATVTPQSQPIPGKDMVANHAGGFVFKLDAWKRLDRFLILGSESSTYYVSGSQLTDENVKCLLALLAEDGSRFVSVVAGMLASGRAPKPDHAIFALALAASQGDDVTRKAALATVPTALRTGTHLLKFAATANELRGWGRGLRKAVRNWFRARGNETLALQLVKYQQREGWSMRDLLRLSKPVPKDEVQGRLFGWTARRGEAEWARTASAPGHKALAFVWATEQAHRLRLSPSGPVSEEFGLKIDLRAKLEPPKPPRSPNAWLELIRKYRLPREALPTEALSKAEVWEALLQEMPMTAMIRNLGVMSRVGLITPGSAAEKLVTARLTDAARLRAAKVHPIQVLSALRTYSAGRGYRSRSKWRVSQPVVTALDDAFELSFGAVEPAGTRQLLALDVSGSMGTGEIAGVPRLTPSAATAALAVVAARTEPWTRIMGFGNTFRHLGITAKDRLPEAMEKVSGLTFGATDASVPMTWATDRRLAVDTFVVLTDNETWAGSIQPVQALESYRQASGINAKLIVVGMTSTGFTIADPEDAGMLDVVGFDGATPVLMAKFAQGLI
jgi:60 kDa SS-A/Ro ribonucleoprotein